MLGNRIELRSVRRYYAVGLLQMIARRNHRSLGFINIRQRQHRTYRRDSHDREDAENQLPAPPPDRGQLVYEIAIGGNRIHWGDSLRSRLSGNYDDVVR